MRVPSYLTLQIASAWDTISPDNNFPAPHLSPRTSYRFHYLHSLNILNAPYLIHLQTLPHPIHRQLHSFPPVQFLKTTSSKTRTQPHPSLSPAPTIPPREHRPSPRTISTVHPLKTQIYPISHLPTYPSPPLLIHIAHPRSPKTHNDIHMYISTSYASALSIR